ncbi:helix-hairpin-helix domain-containing protein [Lactococcus nasutitermitis]|uniref:Helix-hairpin-helix domain-containing protein n=1 Tax=Lactococcus nasutitermitis TaxID=1652957 RepID=A0ABV9JBC3_9LACT|nr:ComEA family DNA-binding protein [Lactococcus nasutitermitis]
MEEIIEFIKNNIKIIILSAVALVAGAVFYFVSHGQQPVNTVDSSALISDSSVKTEKTSVKIDESQNSQEMEVDLKGAVKNPAVYKVSSDMRVDDLIKMAGGMLPSADPKTVNLAAKLTDQEVVYVATTGENAPSVTASTTSTASPTDANSANDLTTSSESPKVNINTADLTELQTLSGIGAKKAQDIIDYRTQNGPFASVDDLQNVGGFGDKTIAKIKDSITLD